MAFDANNPADQVTLKNEFNNDPLGMGYAVVQHDTMALLTLFNDPAANIGGENINRPTEELQISGIAAVIDVGEYSALADWNQAWLRMFVSRPEDVTLEPYQDKFLEIFPSSSVTRTAVLALRSKLASRFEILFAVNDELTRDDWIIVRAS